MKTVYYTKYVPPDVLQVKEVEKPMIEDNQLLVRVHATTVSSGDSRMRRGNRKSLPLWPISKMAIGLRKPKNPVLGMDFAGEVVSKGKNVSRLRQGDHVYGFPGKGGSNAEYIKVSEESSVTVKPSNMTFEEAASVPFGAVSALFFLRKGKIKKGDDILIYGASGSVGTYAIQLAKYYGAKVTGVCSTENVEMVKSLGADDVVDYKRENYTNRKQTYDIIFDTVGKTTFSHCRKLLKPKGYYVLAVMNYREAFQILWTSLFGERKVISGIATGSIEDFNFLNNLIEEGKLKAVIDRSYHYNNIADAHRYVDKGHKKGNVVIKWI
ncbi:NAD(P)-dependent alcohol dehydrogenase [Bacillus carboniphilus]|uniref:NAD(P)-dependent alcohol dehydrogenase n=1 Tax=Bacillus carboniphilus TaxID=86663 RepID=A0ABY9JTK5_9BACI|nr:NAD(P)-dependent alcohol dehydrogenase [Bacillus carboniphilus]WLR42083.1 NAD(P)-dependent alcohol dehydrogenase [Bacillus carboniphilus]